jgi:phosphatidylglycerol---prolipoprotein diacylglyceryl transferase
MKVVLFYIGDFPVRSYGIVVGIAILLAIGVAHYLAKDTPYRKHVMDLAFYMIVGSIIGARFWEVFFFRWNYYSNHLTEILAIWNGGLSIQGAFAGGFIAALIYTKRYKLNFWSLADTIIPAVAFGQGIGRVACLLNGDAFGSPTNSGFGLVYPPGTAAYETYGSQPLWPAEVWEGQWDLVIFGLLLILKNRKWPPGFLFLTYYILYSLGRFLLEFLRGDSPRYLWDFTAAQWTSVAIITVCMIFIVLRISCFKKEGTEQRSSL